MTRRPRAHRHGPKPRLAVIPLTIAMAFGALLAPLGPVAPAPVAAATDRLPDLRMAKLSDFRIVVSNGRRLLRFSSTMTNLGAGAFEIRSNRTSTTTPWNIDQIIFNDASGFRRIDTTATMQYGGDGHGHWHVQRMVDADLWSTWHHAKGSKIGYCFFDTTLLSPSLPGSPSSPVYRETMCARLSGLTSRVGISVGWGDRYQWSLPFQWVDITGLPSADYHLRAIVDARNLFTESSNANNCTYTRIRISTSSSVVTVLGSGSTCINDWSGTTYAADIAWALSERLTHSCGVDLFCPNDRVTRAELATWLVRAFDLPWTTNDYFTDDETSPNEADINRLAAAGLTSGCGAGRYCPTQFASRGELATILVRALGVPPTSTDYFTDDESSVHEANINALAEAGIASGCGTRLYCPYAAVLRGPLAAFLHRALD
jgi:hypothetical protein